MRKNIDPNHLRDLARRHQTLCCPWAKQTSDALFAAAKLIAENQSIAGKEAK